MKKHFFLHVIHVLKTKMIHIGYFIYNYFHNFMIKIKFNGYFLKSQIINIFCFRHLNKILNCKNQLL